MCLKFFFLILRPPPISTLFPYTTLFRSRRRRADRDHRTARALHQRLELWPSSAAIASSDMPRRTAARRRRSRARARAGAGDPRSEEHTSELQSRLHLVCRLLLEKKKEKQ